MDRVWYDTTRFVLESSPFEDTKKEGVHNSAIMSLNVKTQLEDMWLLNLAFEATDACEDLWSDPWTKALLVKRGDRTFGGSVMQYGLWHASWEDFDRAAKRCERVFQKPLEFGKLPSHFGDVTKAKSWANWFKVHPEGASREAWLNCLTKQKLLIPLWVEKRRVKASFVESMVGEDVDFDACKRVVSRIKRWNEEVSWLSLVSECAVKGRLDVLNLFWSEKKPLILTQASKELEKSLLYVLRKTEEAQRTPILSWVEKNADLFILAFPNCHIRVGSVAPHHVVDWGISKWVPSGEIENSYQELLTHAPFFESRGFDFSVWKTVLERRMLQNKAKNKGVEISMPVNAL